MTQWVTFHLRLGKPLVIFRRLPLIVIILWECIVCGKLDEIIRPINKCYLSMVSSRLRSNFVKVLDQVRPVVGVELKNRQHVLHIMLPQQLQRKRVSRSQALNPVRPDNSQSTHIYICLHKHTHAWERELAMASMQYC